MAEAKTPEERQALMMQQQEKMREKMPGMQGAHPMGQMGGMGSMGPHHHMMQQQRPQSGG